MTIPPIMEFAARDLRVVCVHEYGHLLVARHYAIAAEVSIKRNENAGASDRHYVGNVTLYQSASPRVQRHIGLAGVIAECRDQEDQVSALDIADLLEAGVVELSPSDTALAKGFLQRDIEECLELIEHMWDDILAAANARIASESTG